MRRQWIDENGKRLTPSTAEVRVSVAAGGRRLRLVAFSGRTVLFMTSALFIIILLLGTMDWVDWMSWPEDGHKIWSVCRGLVINHFASPCWTCYGEGDWGGHLEWMWGSQYYYYCPLLIQRVIWCDYALVNGVSKVGIGRPTLEEEAKVIKFHLFITINLLHSEQALPRAVSLMQRYAAVVCQWSETK